MDDGRVQGPLGACLPLIILVGWGWFILLVVFFFFLLVFIVFLILLNEKRSQQVLERKFSAPAF